MFYTVLKKLCNDADTSVSAVLEELGISVGAATAWKKGKAAPNSVTVKKIADRFNVTPEFLLGGAAIAAAPADNDFAARLLSILESQQDTIKSQQETISTLVRSAPVK